MSITLNEKRIAAFTSSEIYRLCTSNVKKEPFGAPGLSYINEKRLEKRLGRSINVETYTQAMAWGKFNEVVVHQKLGTSYNLSSTETDAHPTIAGWSGSKDCMHFKNGKPYAVVEMKAYQPKHFAEYTDVLLKQDVELLKSQCLQEYYQIVSNAIINGVEYGCAISYMPYESELPVLRELAENWPEPGEEWKYRFISEKDKSCLAYLPDGGYYKDLNRFEFRIPDADKQFLTDRVNYALKLL